MATLQTAIGGVGPGTLLAGRYEVAESVASGGMAVVFRGYDRLLQRPVAIKALHPHFVGTPAAARFVSEARIAAALNHPGLVTIHDIVDQDGTPCLVLEYADGESLQEVIEREAPIPVEQGLRWARELCEGLAHAHDRGVIHRDIKPQNVVVTPSGRLKILDFGISRGPGSGDITEAGFVLGTAHYVAPEVARGGAATPSSDLYALGVVLYRLLTGHFPVDGPDSATIMARQVFSPVPSPSAYVPSLPRPLEAVLMRLLEKEPGRRYDSAPAVLRDLQGVTLPAAPDEERTRVLPHLPLRSWDAPGRMAALGKATAWREWAVRATERGEDLLGSAILLWRERVAANPRRLKVHLPALLLGAIILGWVLLFAAGVRGPGPAQAVSSQGPGAEQAPAQEVAAGLVAAVDQRTENIRDGGGARLRQLTGELALYVVHGDAPGYKEQRKQVEREIERLVKEGLLLPAPAGRVKDQLKGLDRAMERRR